MDIFEGSQTETSSTEPILESLWPLFDLTTMTDSVYETSWYNQVTRIVSIQNTTKTYVVLRW
jgi:hypothetical protein